MAFRGDEGRGKAAKSFGKLLTSCDPEISEWGNPALLGSFRKEGKPGELKHLSTLRKRNQLRFP